MSQDLIRVQHVARLINGFPFSSEDFLEANGMPLIRIRDLQASEPGTFVDPALVPAEVVIRKGDVVIGMDGDFNSVLWDREPGAMNQRVCLLRALDGNDPRFIAYALPQKLRAINEVTYSTTVKHLSSWDVEHIWIPRLSPQAQRAVANYLDRETGKIDALIERQRQLIDGLRARRSSAIAHGIAGSAQEGPRKPSGLRWLGDVPGHWSVGNIRRFATMKTGHTPSRSVPEYWTDTTIPWITLADVWQLRSGRTTYIRETAGRISKLGLQNSAAELLPAGTVVLSRTASVGFAGIISKAMATSQDYWNWVCGPLLLPEFLLYVFRAMWQEFKALSAGSTHKTIYKENAASFRIPVPPIDEQREIVEHLDQETARIDALIDKSERLIGLSQERRSALITAAVTGQVNVTEREFAEGAA